MNNLQWDWGYCVDETNPCSMLEEVLELLKPIFDRKDKWSGTLQEETAKHFNVPESIANLILAPLFSVDILDYGTSPRYPWISDDDITIAKEKLIKEVQDD